MIKNYLLRNGSFRMRFLKQSAILIVCMVAALVTHAQNVPELMYYQFDSPGVNQANNASAPVGSNPSPIVGSMSVGSTGQFGTALIGTGLSSASNYVDNGWATNLVSIDWTIGFWINNVPSGSTLYYLMGDAGNSLRFFVNGAPGAGNGRLTGTGLPNIDVTGVTGAPTYLHFVRTVSPNEVKVYKNGVYINSYAITGTITTGSGFKVGGQASSNSLNGEMDEFRLYNRALDATEIAATWNSPLPLSACIAPPTPGTATAFPSSGLCVGSNIGLGLSGNSYGSGQTYQWQSSPTPGFASPTNVGSLQTNAGLNTPATVDLYYRCLVTCSGNTQISSSVFVTVNPQFPGGIYTINSAVVTGGSNFQTFNDFKNAIACGISGSIIVNVAAASGPYIEQVEFPEIGGVSAVNTITINGNGNTLSFGATLSSDPGTLVLNGTDYMTVNDLIVEGTGATYALVCHLWNQADNNKFNNCTFNAPANGTSTSMVPFSISGSATSGTASGISGDNNIITGCTMYSGYYNTCLVGNPSSLSVGNQVINCNIVDQYLYGMYNLYQDGAILRGNDVSRPTRTTLSTFYGIYVQTGCQNMLVERNRIHDPWTSNTSSTTTSYGIYSTIDATAGNENRYYNNLMYDFNSNGIIYGMYMSGSDYWKAYHNTISLDDVSSSTTSTTYGIYATGTVDKDIQNNIVTITRGGTGTKYGVYITTPAVTICDYNDIYVNGAAGTNNIGYNGTAYTTLATWQGTGFDLNSQSENPLYVSPLTDVYAPTNGLINNIGNALGVLVDIDGAPRSATNPDPGAYEFSVGGLDAGISWVSPVSPSTAGLKTIIVNIVNTQTTTINTINISYNDGGTPVTQLFTGLNLTAGNNTNLSFSTQYNLTGSVTMTADIITVNGGTDAIVGNNSATYGICVGLNGTYTINAANPTGGTNFQSFTDAVAALNCGIAGPVVFNVVAASGPYNEQIDMPEVFGSSAVNTITFNGNNNLLTYGATVSTSPHTFTLSGADYVIVNNLNIEGTGATYALVCHLWNQSDNNAFNNCTFTAPDNGTSTSMVPFSISGSATSGTASGTSGNYNVITGCTMNGGYYNTCLVGASGNLNVGNQVINCNILDQYLYGLYNLYQDGTVLRGNNLSRPTRTALSTYYGLYVSTGCVNMLVENNRIHDTWATNPTQTGTQYSIYCTIDASVGNENRFYNNLVYDINFGGAIYGMYMSGSDYWKAYHNTISLDDVSASTTSTTYGIYSTGTVAKDIQNNNISITRGGTGTKYGVYITNPAAAICDYNNIYVNGAAGTNTIGYNGTSYGTLAAWQGTGFDLNSVSADPLYFNTALGNYKPTEVALDNIGTPLGILTDIDGAPRSPSSPDPGAYEFSVANKDVGVFAFDAPNLDGCYSNAEAISVTIRNYGVQQINFGVEPVTVFCEITGPITTTVSATISSGILAIGNTQSVALTPSVNLTANGTYSFKAYTMMGVDGQPANDTLPSFDITVGPIAGTISSTLNSICVTGDPTLTIIGNYGGAIQWQQSTVSATGPWTNVGAGNTSYTAIGVTQTTHYRAQVSCNANSVNTNVVTIIVSTPSLSSTAPATRCGIGTVTLGATASGSGVPLWYANSTGGTALASGNSFITPVINSTTNYFVSSSEGGSSGITIPGDGAWDHFTTAGSYQTTLITGAYMILTVDQPLTLSSVDIYPSAALGTAFSVEARTGSASGPSFATYSGVTTVSNSGNPTIEQTLLLNWVLPAGTYYIGFPTTNPNTWRSGLATHTFPWVLPGVASIDYYLTPSYQYYFYNLKLSTGCESGRTMVTATVTPSPTLNITAGDIGVCSGNSTTVSVNSINDPNYSYVWTSNPPGFSASGTGPHVVSPSVTTSYIVTATDLTAGPNAGCVNIDSVEIFTGGPLTAGTVAASQTSYCVSGSPILTVSGYDGGAIQWQSSTVSATGPWTNVGTNSDLYSPGTITQTTYFRANVFCQATSLPSNVETIDVLTPLVTNTTPATRCGAGPVTLGATGSAGTTLRWYDAPSGGAALATGPSFTTNATTSTNYYVSASTGAGGTDYATMPAQTGTFTGNVRGYWFTAPADFTITGLYVPLTGTSQSIAVVRFDGNTPPPTYSASTNAFTTLFLTQNNPATGMIPCNVNILAGDVIGILGQAGNITSYGPTTNPVNVNIAGSSVPLTRMLMQFPLNTTAPQDISQELTATTQIGRVEFEYSQGCESARVPVPVTLTPSPSISATSALTTVCDASPTTVQVSSSNDPNYDYTWSSIPAGFSANGPGPHTVLPAGATTYQVFAIDNNAGPNFGCGSYDNVDISTVPNSLGLAVTSTPGDVCEGEDAQLLAVGTAPGYTMSTNCGVSFIDISSTGTSVGTLGDDLEYNITIPSFTFNGVAYTTARVATNGVVIFGSTSGDVFTGNVALPTTAITAGNSFISPYWDDLDVNLGGTIKTQTVGNNFIIQWTGIDHHLFTTGDITFQIQLNLITGVVSFIYSDVVFGSTTYDFGVAATIGIQMDAANAIQYSFNTASLVNGLSICFTPNTPTFSYDWTSNSTFLSATNVSNPIAQAATSTQVYTAIITDISNGCQKSADYTLNVNPLPQPTASSNSPVCEGQSVSFFGNNIASGQTTGNSYLWTGPNGFNDIVQNPILSNATAAANGTYTVTVTNQFGCSFTTTTLVTVAPPPALNIQSQTNVSCNGGFDGAFTIEVTNGVGFYLYDQNGNINFDGIFTGFSAGLYIVQVTDGNSCASSIPVTITEPDPTTLPDAGQDQTSCVGATVTLAGNTAAVGTGTWTVVAGSGTFTNANDPATTVTGVGAGLNTYAWTIDNAVCFISNSDNVNVTTNVLPTATVSGTTSICNGQTANLTLDFTGTGPWTYSYSNGSTTFGPFATSNNPEIVQVSPTVATTYSLVGIDDSNCSGTVSGSASITVVYSPPVGSIYTFTAPTTACFGTIATITTNAVSGATSYTWSGPAGTLFDGQPGPYSSASNSVSVEFGILSTTSGYSICATAVNACGQSNTRCIWIRGTVSTPAPITGSTVGCPNTTGPYSTSTVVGAANYFWTASPQMQIIAGQGTPNVTVRFLASFTSGTICVVGVTSCGSTSTARCMTVNKATSTPGTMSGPFAQCPGQTGQVFSIDPVAGAASYTWTVPANVTLTSGQGTPSITVSVGSTFNIGNICVTATSICGIVSAPRCKTISSVQPNTPGNITGPNSGVCGQSITYSVPAQSGVTSYNWVVPVGATIVGGSGTNTVQITFASNFTTGQLCVTAENGCGSSTARCVNIKGVPADLSVITGPNPVCSYDAGLLYYINPAFGATSYVWTVPAGASIVAGQGTNAIIVDYGIGGGLVTVKAVNGCGQSGTRTLNVIVNCRMAGSLPNATLNAYPNPVSSDLTIDLDATTSGSYVVELLDLSGRIVKSEVMNAIIGLNRNSMDVSTLAKGMYLLNVKNEDGFSQQMRIAVE